MLSSDRCLSLVVGWDSCVCVWGGGGGGVGGAVFVFVIMTKDDYDHWLCFVS